MPIDTSGDAMTDELAAADEASKRTFCAWDEMIRRLHGPYFEQGADAGKHYPVNPGFEMVATTSAQIIAGDPECFIQATRFDRPEIVEKGKALQHVLNRLARDMRMKRNLRKLFMDWYLKRACTYLVRQRAPWMDRGPLDGPVVRPAGIRVPPKNLRQDARATDWDETRWRGHELLASKSAILERAKKEKGWRINEINAIDGETEIDHLIAEGGKRVQRDDFKLLVVWFPEEQLDEDLGPDEGFHGTQHFYACTQRARKDGTRSAGLVEIRDPQSWFGPRRGPYNRSGMYYVPDKVEPLSVMVAIEHVARSLGMRASVIEQAMANYKKVLIEGTGERNLANRLKMIAHGGVLKAKGFDKSKVAEYATGGLDAQMLEAFAFDQRRMEQLSGVTETAKGNVRAGLTATAETIAAAGASSRTEAMRDEFGDFVREEWLGYAEVIDADDEFYMPLPPEAQRDGVQAIALRGGRSDGESFEDYELKVNPLQMGFRSEQERIAAAEREWNLFAQLNAMVPTPGFVASDWTGLLEDMGAAYRIPELPRRLNENAARQIATLFLQTEIAGALQPGEARPVARSVADSGVNGRKTVVAAQQAQASRMQPPAQLGQGSQGGAPSRPARSSSGSGGMVKRQPTPGAKSGAQAGAGAKSKAKAGAF